MAENTRKRGAPPLHQNYDESARSKVLSCQGCRVRKVKCNLQYPCLACVKIGAECVRITSDMRKKRPPANYVLSLEKKVAQFSRFFDTFRALRSTEAKAEYVENHAWEVDHEVPEEPHLEHENERIRPVYGPTSVYDNEPTQRDPSQIHRREETGVRQLNTDPDVLHCLKLFFKWQYPDHNMFIFRELFLTDFFDPKPTSMYCLRVLVLSICAMGARMSDSELIYQKLAQYYREARSLLFSRFDRPSITSLQSFLVLAFYDICNGNNSAGWMLSGNAMRMGFDLGFQLNPEVWFLKPQENLSPLDTAIRSRIYWGSYLADHFISLVLGRPSVLKVSDASIPETGDLPDLAWIDDYMYLTPEEEKKKLRNTNISNPLKNVVNLINISDNMLNDIFTKTEDDSVDANHNIEDLNLVSRLEKLYQYNAEITDWKKTLPEDLNWDKASLALTADNPSFSSVKYYYYILLLCLNRPFVGLRQHQKQPDSPLAPSLVCNDVIEDLYVAIKRFEEVHGLRRVSIFIVYCSILSISILFLTHNSRQLVDDKREKLHFFMAVLDGCSKTWKLAEKSYKLIKIKLQYRHESEIDMKTEAVSEEVKSASQTPAPQAENNYVTEPALEPSQHHILALAPHHMDAQNQAIANQNTDLLFVENLEFFGGPPVLMTSDLFNEDWESLFPDYVFNPKN